MSLFPVSGTFSGERRWLPELFPVRKSCTLMQRIAQTGLSDQMHISLGGGHHLHAETHSYGRVAAFARSWKADRQRDAQTSGRGTFVPLVFQPGEAFQFD
jgi:hypothetical protein